LNSLRTDVLVHVTATDRPRDKALEILRRVEGGVFADALLEQVRQAFDGRDSSFIVELVYGTLRNRSWLDWVLNVLSVQSLEKTDVWTRNILRLGAYQLLFLDRVPASAAVNTAVNLAKVYGKKHGYVNGLLRNLDRRRNTITYPETENPAKRFSVLYSHPEWLVKRWLRRFGIKSTETLLRNNNLPAPLVIRTNILRSTRAQLCQALASQGVATKVTHYSPVGLEIVTSPGIRSLMAYEQGWFIVQDEAAQLIGLMLDPKPGEAVLDACAAPGGKATHLAELMHNQGTVIALDNNPERIARIVENSTRLGITIIDAIQGDATNYHEGTFDRILIDAPCSGLGVLRRHPDGRWNKRERLIKDRAVEQQRILENCARLLKPGGALVYATCTTEPEENEEIVNLMLDAAGTGCRLDDPRPFLPASAASFVSDKGFLRTYPQEPGMDGFFGARLVRDNGP